MREWIDIFFGFIAMWIDIFFGFIAIMIMLIVIFFGMFSSDSMYRYKVTKENLIQSLKDNVIREDGYNKEIILEKNKATSCGPDEIYGTKDDIVVRRYSNE